MSKSLRALRAVIPQQFQHEHGSISVDAVIWIPIYAVMTSLIMDVALMLDGQARATRILQDSNRLISTGFLDSASEVRDEAEERLDHISPNATVETSVNGDVVTTVAVIPASDLDAIGFLYSFAEVDITVSATHLIEL